jgi:hypothetical protein
MFLPSFFNNLTGEDEDFYVFCRLILDLIDMKVGFHIDLFLLGLTILLVDLTDYNENIDPSISDKFNNINHFYLIYYPFIKFNIFYNKI